MGARAWVLVIYPLLLAPAPAHPVCPAGLSADPAREIAIRARLEDDPEARGILREAPAFTLCFGPGIEAGVTPEGAVLLPIEMPRDHAAARAAHLVHHRRAGSPLASPPRGDCARWVERALDEEADAHALELRLLGAAAPSLPFAAIASAAPENERRAVIRRWLVEHRTLENDYAARCRAQEGRGADGLSSNDCGAGRGALARPGAPR